MASSSIFVVATLVLAFIGTSQGAAVGVNQDAECLHAHNMLRALHSGTGPLQWDAGLARDSVQYAKELVKKGSLKHSSGPYGENLAMGWGSSPRCASSVLSWYNEYTKHDFSSNDFIYASGHFTQVVWKSSTKVGVGVAYDKQTRRWVICARYTPAGNFGKRFLKNVVPRKPNTVVPSVNDIVSSIGQVIPTGPALITTKSPSQTTQPPRTQQPPTTNVKLLDQADECLHAHNVLRSLHKNTGPLQWDTKLTAESAQYAAKLATQNYLQHSRGPYGENLFMAFNTKPSCAAAVKSWYDEYKKHNFQSNNYNSATGHFTQIVWRGSTAVGVGVAYNPKTRVWVVCGRYTPAGNVRRAFLSNVASFKRNVRVPTLTQIINGVKPNTNAPPATQVVTKRPTTKPRTLRPQPPTIKPTCRDIARNCNQLLPFCSFYRVRFVFCKSTCGVCKLG